MNQIVHSRFALAAWALAAAALGSCEATQPRPYCRVQQDQYAARYIMQGTPQGNCTGKILTGEILNLQYYRALPNDPMGTTSVAIAPASVVEAAMGMGTPMGTEFSLGKYTTVNPGDDNLCTAPTFTETNLTVGSTRLSYAWSNLQMIVTPVSNGIHFGADLVRKDGDCTVTYKVSAVNPALHCGDGVDQMGHADPSTGKPVATACEAKQGSGLSPELQYECDATPDGAGGTHLCLPARAFPSRK
jgi:hypothetical protein